MRFRIKSINRRIIFKFMINFDNFEKIFMVGGGSRSSFWIELLASLLNRNLSVCGQSEYGAALGVARLAMHSDKSIQNNNIIKEITTSKDAAEIKNLVKVPLNNNELNALISFTYNVGLGAFKASSLLRLLNSGADKKIVADQFDRWVYDNGVKVKGLIYRRNAEKKLFLS